MSGCKTCQLLRKSMYKAIEPTTVLSSSKKKKVKTVSSVKWLNALNEKLKKSSK